MTERDEYRDVGRPENPTCYQAEDTTIECEGSLLLRSGQHICEAHHRADLRPGLLVTLLSTGDQLWIVEAIDGWDVRLRWEHLLLRVPAWEAHLLPADEQPTLSQPPRHCEPKGN